MVRRWLIVAFVLALVAAACSSSDDSDEATTESSEAPSDTGAEGPEDTSDGTEPEAMEPGSQVGITDTELNMSVIYADLAPIVAAGLVPEFGDYEVDFDLFIERANEQDRFGGRTANLTYHTFGAGASPTDQLPACVEATEDRDNFIVISPGGIAQETILCVTEGHETLMLAIAGANTPSLYERSAGRFFNNAIGVERLFEVAVRDYTEQGLLDGATIGIVRASEAEDDEAAEVLKAELEANGHTVAEEVTLPCANNQCEGNETGVEALRSADVDTVFSFLGPTAYPAFVGAAGAVGYTPQWLSSDYENQVFETTARWMQEVREFYDGAIGTTSAVQQSQVDEFRQECNDYFTEQTGTTYTPLTDAWRLVGNACELVDRIARVIEKIEADGLEVGQDTFIKYMEAETVLNGDRTGSFGPDKHDAYDVTAQLVFVPDCNPDAEDGITVCWQEIEGTRKTWEG